MGNCDKKSHRIESNLLRLRELLSKRSIDHIGIDSINAESMYKALDYLNSRAFNEHYKQSKVIIDIRRCLADTLLLMDGVDLQDATFSENIEAGTKQNESISEFGAQHRIKDNVDND